MMKVLDHKALLYIPLMAWENGELKKIDISEEIGELASMLSEAGIKSFYKTKAKGFYKDRAYPEELLTVFGEEETALDANAFIAWNKKHKEKLKQEAFAYESDGQLFILENE